jgi:hypothetical protein
VLKAEDHIQPALPRTAAVALPTPEARLAPEDLVAALYRGLGVDVGTLTASIRRRELAIARELLAVGATPAEVEAYAREASTMPGRIAAVDLRSFERERASWPARRRRPEPSGRRLVDRTGQPAGSSLARPAERAAGEPLGSPVGEIARAMFGGAS